MFAASVLLVLIVATPYAAGQAVCASGTMTQSQIDKILGFINDRRVSILNGQQANGGSATMLPSGTDMTKIEWNCNLETEAKTAVGSTCIDTAPSAPPTNAAFFAAYDDYTYYNVDYFFTQWMSQIDKFSIATSSITPNEVLYENTALRHYANLVRAATTGIGCYELKCPDLRYTFYCLTNQPELNTGEVLYTIGTGGCTTDQDCVDGTCEVSSGLCIPPTTTTSTTTTSTTTTTTTTTTTSTTTPTTTTTTTTTPFTTSTTPTTTTTTTTPTTTTTTPSTTTATTTASTTTTTTIPTTTTTTTIPTTTTTTIPTTTTTIPTTTTTTIPTTTATIPTTTTTIPTTTTTTVPTTTTTVPTTTTTIPTTTITIPTTTTTVPTTTTTLPSTTTLPATTTLGSLVTFPVPGDSSETQRCPSNTLMTDTLRYQFLDMHNYRRSELAKGNIAKSNGVYLPAASDMQRMRWNCGLETEVEQYLKTCPKAASEESTRSGIGENFFRISQDEVADYAAAVQKAVTTWWKIVRTTNAVGMAVTFRAHHVGAPISTFTQMAWSTSRKLACSVVKCSSDYIVVCRYSPAGNIVEHTIYTKGNPCTACPANAWCTYDSLCTLP